MNTEKNEHRATPAEIHRRAIGRWENDGGAAPASLHKAPGPPNYATVAGKIGDAEDGNIRVRLIAIENILVALLADAPGDSLELIREMSAFISPRPGATPHRLTIEAARNMMAIVERAEHYRRIRE